MEKHAFIYGQAISQTVLFLTQTFSDGSFYFIQDNKAEQSLIIVSVLTTKTS